MFCPSMEVSIVHLFHSLKFMDRYNWFNYNNYYCSVEAEKEKSREPCKFVQDWTLDISIAELKVKISISMWIYSISFTN